MVLLRLNQLEYVMAFLQHDYELYRRVDPPAGGFHSAVELRQVSDAAPRMGLHVSSQGIFINIRLHESKYIPITVCDWVRVYVRAAACSTPSRPSTRPKGRWPSGRCVWNNCLSQMDW